MSRKRKKVAVKIKCDGFLVEMPSIYARWQLAKISDCGCQLLFGCLFMDEDEARVYA